MHRRFNLVLGGWLGAMLLGFSGVALWLEPMRGDLTRLGFYAENDFGWRGEEKRFVPPLAGVRGDAEIVVIGDSYSLPTTPDRQTGWGGFWTDHLAALTGLSVGVVDHTGGPIAAAIEAVLAQGKPRLVIIEIAERTLRQRLGDRVGCGELSPARPVRTLGMVAAPVEPEKFERGRTGPLEMYRRDYLLDFARANLLRAVGRSPGGMVWRVRLARDDLFSSRRPGELLVYQQDYERAAWSAEDWGRIACGLRGLAARARSGGADVLVLIAPDKASVYAPYLAPADRAEDAVSRLAGMGVDLVRVDLALRRAVAAGGRDVYLPNDTHWGSLGAWIAAEAVLRHTATEIATRGP